MAGAKSSDAMVVLGLTLSDPNQAYKHTIAYCTLDKYREKRNVTTYGSSLENYIRWGFEELGVTSPGLSPSSLHPCVHPRRGGPT